MIYPIGTTPFILLKCIVVSYMIINIDKRNGANKMNEPVNKVTVTKNHNGMAVKLIASNQLFSNEPALECWKQVDGEWIWVDCKPKTGWRETSVADYKKNHRAEVYQYFSPARIIHTCSMLTRN